MEVIFVVSKLIAVEYTLLRGGLPQQLVDARYTDIGLIRTYFLEIPAFSAEMIDFVSELHNEGREYRLMDLKDSPLDLPEVNLDDETHNL